MNIETVDISTNANELVVLSGRTYEKEYTALPNSNLPQDLFNKLDLIFKYLTGNDLSPDEHTFIIKSQDGYYSRLFGPILKVDEEDKNYVLQWGNTLVPVTIDKNSICAYRNVEDGGTVQIELDAEFGEFNFSGRGEDAALLMSVEDEEDVYTLPVAIRFVDWDNKPSYKELNAYLKKNPVKLKTVLQKYKKPEGAGERIEADFETDLREFTLNEPYKVIGYYKCNTSYGINFRLFIQDPDGKEGVGIGWACPSIRPLLMARPVITREKPAELRIISRRELDSGKVSIKGALVLSEQKVTDSDRSLNLKF